MRIACWITTATGTYSEYVILTAFPRQKWLRERALLLCYSCIDCPIIVVLCYSLRKKIYIERISVWLRKSHKSQRTNRAHGKCRVFWLRVSTCLHYIGMREAFHRTDRSVRQIRRCRKASLIQHANTGQFIQTAQPPQVFHALRLTITQAIGISENLRLLGLIN
jgi:hypothetical protein